MPIKLNCRVCKREFKLPPSAYKRGYRSCSRACKEAWFRQKALDERHVPVQPVDYRIIALTGGREAKVSIEDYEWLNRTMWSVNSADYVTAAGHKMMHREIMLRLVGEYKPGECDHINMDRHDNRRSNLRIVSRASNMANRKILANSTQPYKGVKQNYHRWYAIVHFDKKRFYSMMVDTPEEAAWMYDQIALALRGDYVGLNFDYQ